MRRERRRKLILSLFALDACLLVGGSILTLTSSRQFDTGSWQFRAFTGTVWFTACSIALLLLFAIAKKAFNPKKVGFWQTVGKVAKWLPKSPFLFLEVLLDDPTPSGKSHGND